MGGGGSTFEHYKGTQHLVFFVHGMGMNGHKHCLYLKHFIEHIDERNEITKVHLAQALVGSLSLLTFKNTTAGILKGANMIRAELELVIKACGDSLKYISLVGASMGGLYLRCVLPHIVDMTNAELCNFITLATPHFGVSGLDIKVSPFKLGLVQTGCDLVVDSKDFSCLNNVNVMNLCEDYYLDVLKKFKRRIAYAPIFNDGIVPFPSAAMQLSYPRNYTDNPIQIEYKGVKTSIEYGKEPYIIAHTDNYESMYYILYFKI